MKDNVSRNFKPRHVIPDTRISSGQCPRCDVNFTWGARDFQGHTKKRALRHIHVKIGKLVGSHKNIKLYNTCVSSSYLILYSWPDDGWLFTEIRSDCTGWLKSLCASDEQSPHNWLFEYIRNVDRAILNTVFENTVRRVNKCLETGGGTLTITYNFMYCNHQVHRGFFITLYKNTFVFARTTEVFVIEN
jgi:hypothetical protein